MKKIFIIGLCVCILLISSISAQAQWNFTLGNPVTSTTQYLGTDGASTSPLQLKTIETGGSALPINFFTSNVQRMTILANGKVGINLTNPARMLEVLDASSPQLRLTQVNATDFTEFQTLTSGAGFSIFQTNGLVGILNEGANPSHIGVGIGIQPVVGSTWNLTIHSDDAVSVVTQYTNQNTGGNQTSGFVTGIVSTGDAILQQNQDQMDIRFSTTNTTLFERMRIHFDGNVGIGNFSASAPVRKLDVDGDARIRTMTTDNTITEVVVRNPSNGDLFVNTAIGTNAMNAWEILGNSNVTAPTNFMGTTNANDVAFRSNNVERMRIIGLASGAVLAGNVGIGLTNPTARFHSEYAYVTNTTPLKNGLFDINGSYTTGAVVPTLIAVEGNSIASGTSSASSNNIGGNFTASNANTKNYAGYFYGTLGSGGSGADNYGVYAEATGGGANSFGVYCKNGAGATNWALYANGRTFSPTMSWTASDQQFKKEVKPINGALSIINKLKPCSFHFKTDEYGYMGFDTTLQFGLIAQEAVTVVSNIVMDASQPEFLDTAGNIISPALKFKAINYGELISILIAALKEEDSTVQVLSSKVAEMQAQLDACCNNSMRLQDQGSNPSQTITIVSEASASLGDCKPNPADGNTIITVKVPGKISEALIIFTDQLGKEVVHEAITNRGYSDLKIETSQLENGIYQYSLVADGKVIDTKQMVKQH